MWEFAELFRKLDESNKTLVKVDALANYFRTAKENNREKDVVWTIALMGGKRPRRPVNTTNLRFWASELTDISLTLFEESYHVVGDLAETIALLTSKPQKEKSLGTLSDWMEKIASLKDMDLRDQREFLQSVWQTFDYQVSFVFNKLITGSFRIGISRKLMTRSLAKAFDIEENALAHKLMGNWVPTEISLEKLIFTDNKKDNLSQPYPFYLAYSINDKSSDLGEVKDWQIEWKWDGIRGQIIKRMDEVFVWSRGEELVSDKYPEYIEMAENLPNGAVIDGEILAFKDNFPLNFNALQQRIGRKTISKKILDEVPVVFMAYDLLEFEGEDWRQKPMLERRKKLEEIVASANNERLILSEIVEVKNWNELDDLILRAREFGTEGFMLKKLDSIYEIGRKKGNWWKWKSEPFTIDAVLTYAMRGHGRRANLYTDYTFGLWQDGNLVTFAKAYSGLTDKEFEEVDRFVKRNTLERFGPVRQVKAVHVFELAFEGISYSKRHKSGVAVRFPRILRWRKDKKIEEANTLDDLIQLIPNNEITE